MPVAARFSICSATLEASPENKAMIETLVQSAFNDANDKLQIVIEDYTKRQLQSLGLGGFGL